MFSDILIMKPELEAYNSPSLSIYKKKQWIGLKK